MLTFCYAMRRFYFLLSGKGFCHFFQEFPWNPLFYSAMQPCCTVHPAPLCGWFPDTPQKLGLFGRLQPGPPSCAWHRGCRMGQQPRHRAANECETGRAAAQGAWELNV